MRPSTGWADPVSSCPSDLDSDSDVIFSTQTAILVDTDECKALLLAICAVDYGAGK